VRIAATAAPRVSRLSAARGSANSAVAPMLASGITTRAPGRAPQSMYRPGLASATAMVANAPLPAPSRKPGMRRLDAGRSAAGMVSILKE
jgi:hypothetical protein